jgi:hypothetical protein
MMIWKTTPGKYSNGDTLYIGNMKVGSVHFDGMISRDDPKKYSAWERITGAMGHYDSEEKAKQAVEKRVSAIINQLYNNLHSDDERGAK